MAGVVVVGERVACVSTRGLGDEFGQVPCGVLHRANTVAGEVAVGLNADSRECACVASDEREQQPANEIDVALHRLVAFGCAPCFTGANDSFW